jgi:hypothetical protein
MQFPAHDKSGPRVVEASPKEKASPMSDLHKYTGK